MSHVTSLAPVKQFSNPNQAPTSLPSTTGFLPSINELAGGNVNTFQPTLNDVIIGMPAQEQGVRPARALPYELNVHAAVNASNHSITLTFSNTGAATVVFQVRSGNPADVVRTYTVEPGKQLSDSWSFASSYSLSVYGLNGFVRYFNGGIGSAAAVPDVVSSYETQGRGFILWQIGNLASAPAQVSVLDAYTGKTETSRLLQPGATLNDKLQLAPLNGWYDLIVTVAGDLTFKYRLAGHVETGDDSFSDPALGASSPSRANTKTCLHCQSGLRQGADRRATLCALTPRFRDYLFPLPIRVKSCKRSLIAES